MEDKDKIKALKGLKVLSRKGVLTDKDERLEKGDIVYDTKNKEYGIFLEIKPTISGKFLIDYLTKKSMAGKQLTNSFPAKETCVILTLSETKDVGEMLRVRYTNSKDLKKVEDTYEEPETLTDLENHCQNECFLECTNECSLWKYKKASNPY